MPFSRVSFYVEASHRFCRVWRGNGATGNIISFPGKCIFDLVDDQCVHTVWIILLFERNDFPWELALFREGGLAFSRAFSNFCLVKVVKVGWQARRNYRVMKWSGWKYSGNIRNFRTNSLANPFIPFLFIKYVARS